MSPYRLEFELPGLPKTLNARMHWAQKYRENQKWMRMVGLRVAGRRPELPLERAKLTLIRCSSASMDFDNLVSGFKPIVDGLVAANVLADDDWETIGVPMFLWEKTEQRHGCVKVIVEELSTGSAQLTVNDAPETNKTSQERRVKDENKAKT